MKLSHRLRIILGTATTAAGVACVASAAFASPVAIEANPLCYGAGVSGTITGTQHVGPVCVPTNLPVLCVAPTAGLGTTIGVDAEACVPI
jgi:hypothetical protein